MTVRPATIDDLEQLSRLFDSYRKFYDQSSNIPGAKSFLKERLEKNESIIFVAASQNALVGFTQLYPIFSSVGLKKAWLLNDLYVEENARKQGIGTALLRTASIHGFQTGAGWLLLQTGSGNISAQALYEKHGWVRENDFFYRFDL